VTGYFQAGPRALEIGDAAPVRALVHGALGITPYEDRALELLAEAERGSTETRALVVERDGSVAALALFGPVAASVAWSLDALVLAPAVDPREVGQPLVDAIATMARAAGARMLLAELPADPVMGRTLSLLRGLGFRQPARIPDYFRDGVALLFLRQDLQSTIDA